MRVLKKKLFSWKNLARGSVFLTLLALFWTELVLIIPFAIFYLRLLIHYNFNLLNIETRQIFLSEIEHMATAGVHQATERLFLAFFIFFVFFQISTFLIAQFTLPVSSSDERKKAAKSFFLFCIGKRSPAIFIKDGIIIEKEEETKKAGYGVALINLNSVLVLQGKVGVPKQVGHWVGGDIKIPPPSKKPFLKRFFQKTKKQKSKGLFRVAGPGVTFIEKKERVFHSFDLRNQNHSKEVSVRTSDGVKVLSKISVTLSLSEEPDLIHVAYVGGRNPNDIKRIVLQEDINKGFITIKNIFNLDQSDVIEVVEGLSNPEKRKIPSISEDSPSYSRFRPYSETRIKILAYAILRREESTNWFELPLDIAEGIFTHILSAQTYQDLYSFDNPEPSRFPLEDQLKQSFTRKVKEQGLLRYQFIKKKEDGFFSGKLNEEISLKKIEKMPVKDFCSSDSRKLLRSYGMKIKSAKFGDLKPESKEITKKVIGMWHTRWERDIKLIKARNKLDTMRILNATRAQLQKDMAYLLSDIYNADPHSDEALALRVFQALETAAADRSNELSPKEIMLTLQNLYQWFISERKISPKDNEFSKKWIRRN